MADLYPIGYISMHVDPGSPGFPLAWIMTDLGWREANGHWYNRHAYPRLWATLADRRRGDEVQVPDLRRGRVELGEPVRLRQEQMPVHSHSISDSRWGVNRFANPSPHVHSFNVDALAPNNGYFVGVESGHWTPRTIGKVTKVREDDRGLSIDMKLDAHQFTDTLSFLKNDMKRLLDAEISQAIIGPNQMRSALGLAPITKENSMSGTTTLKSPSKNIKRKDLSVAMRLMGTNDQDYLLHSLALVQELEEGQKIYRAFELSSVDVLGDTVKVDGTKVAGVLTDVKGNGYRHDEVKLVVDGKLETVGGNEYVIVTPAEPLGEDTLRVVKD